MPIILKARGKRRASANGPGKVIASIRGPAGIRVGDVVVEDAADAVVAKALAQLDDTDEVCASGQAVGNVSQGPHLLFCGILAPVRVHGSVEFLGVVARRGFLVAGEDTASDVFFFQGVEFGVESVVSISLAH